MKLYLYNLSKGVYSLQTHNSQTDGQTLPSALSLAMRCFTVNEYDKRLDDDFILIEYILYAVAGIN